MSDAAASSSSPPRAQVSDSGTAEAEKRAEQEAEHKEENQGEGGSRKRKYDDEEESSDRNQDRSEPSAGVDSSTKRERGEGAADASSAAPHNKAGVTDDAAAAAAQAEEMDPGYVIRLRGLPFGATVPQIVTWLDGLALARVEQPIIISTDSFGRATGTAHVRLADALSQQRALSEEFHRKMMGTRYVEVFASDINDMKLNAKSGHKPSANFDPNYIDYSAQHQHGQAPGQYAGGPSSAPFNVPGADYPPGTAAPAPPQQTGPIILKVRGCAFETSETDLRAFFAPTPIENVWILLDDKQRAAGDAFLEVESEAHVSGIMQRNKQLLGRRYIEVFRSDPQQMAQRMELNGTYAAVTTGNTGGGYRGPHGGGGGGGFHGGGGGGYHGGGGGGYHGGGGYQGGGGGGGGYGGGGRPGGGLRPAPIGTTSCLRVRGLPHNSTEEDLTGFFAEVQVYPLRLHRNTGSGEAFVEFNSTQDLAIAMQKNRHYLKGSSRYLELIPVHYQELAQTVGLPMEQERPPQQQSYHGGGGGGDRYGGGGGSSSYPSHGSSSHGGYHQGGGGGGGGGGYHDQGGYAQHGSSSSSSSHYQQQPAYQDHGAANYGGGY